MLRTLAYIIFLCTGIFALTLIVMFFRGPEERSTFLGKSQDTISLETQKMNLIKKTYPFRNTKQKDVFGFRVFDLPVDIHVGGQKLIIYEFEDDYQFVKKHLTLLSGAYGFNESNEFFGKTLFLNDITPGSPMVRFLTEMQGRAVGFEVLKNDYPELKTLLSQ